MDIYSSVEVKLFGNTTACLSNHTCGMAFIHHYEGVVFLGQFADLVHRCHVAVHAEHPVGYYDAEALSLSFLKAAFEVCHVGIGIAVAYSFANTHSVDYGSVVEGIGDDGILCGEQGLEYTSICIKACCI